KVRPMPGGARLKRRPLRCHLGSPACRLILSSIAYRHGAQPSLRRGFKVLQRGLALRDEPTDKFRRRQSTRQAHALARPPAILFGARWNFTAPEAFGDFIALLNP